MWRRCGEEEAFKVPRYCMGKCCYSRLPKVRSAGTPLEALGRHEESACQRTNPAQLQKWACRSICHDTVAALSSRHVRFHGNTRNVLPTHLMPPRWELQRNVHRTGLLRGLHLHHGALRLDGRRHSQRELLDGRRTDASDRICLASPVRGSHTIKISDRGRDAVLRWQL